MPLDKSGSKASVGRNISKMRAEGYPQDQAVAASLETQRRAKKKPRPKTKKPKAPKGEFDFLKRNPM